MSFLIQNGELIPAADVVLGVSNRSFCYGDGIFESIKVSDGRPLNLNLHMQRMHQGMKVLKMHFPFSFTEVYFKEQITKLLAQQGFSNARLRINLYRNEGGFYIPEQATCSYLITAAFEESPLYIINEKGLSLGLYNDIEKPINKLSAFKTSNSLLYVLAGISAKENGFDECLIINTHQNLVESVSSNFFIIKDGTFYTPTLQSGCINGVMRTVILQILAENNLSLHEVDLLPEDLLQADEVFITNASRGIRWIGAFKHKRYYKTHSTLLLAKLNERLHLQH